MILAVLLIISCLYYFIRRHYDPDFDPVLFEFPDRNTGKGQMYIAGLLVLLVLLLIFRFGGIYESENGPTIVLGVFAFVLMLGLVQRYLYTRYKK